MQRKSSLIIATTVFAAVAVALFVFLHFDSEHLNRARTLAQQNKHDEAIAEYNQAIQNNPKDRNALVGRAASYVSLRKLDQAVQDLSDAIAGDVNNAQLYVRRARIYTKLHNIQKAQDDLEQAIKIDPHMQEAYYEKNVLAEDARLETAMNYNDGLSKTASTELAPQRAEWHMMMKDPSGALAALSETLKVHPNDAETLKARVHIYMLQRKFAEAEADINTVLKLHPNQSDAWVDRGTIRIEKGDEKGALSDLQKAIQLNPQSKRGYMIMGDLYRRSHQFDKAISYYKKQLAVGSPDDSVAYNNMGLCTMLSGQPAKALADLDRALSLRPNFIIALSNRGLAYFSLGQYTDALRDLDKALSMDQRNAFAICTKAAVLNALGREDEALEGFNRSIAISPTPEAYYSRGGIYSRRHQIDKASADISNALKLDPENAEIYILMSQLYTDNDQPAKGVKPIDDYLKRHPGFQRGWAQRGFCYLKMREWDKALADYDRAWHLHGPESRAIILNNVGYIRYQQGRLADAIKFLDRAIILDPNYRTCIKLRAEVFDKMGKHDLARRDWDRAQLLKQRGGPTVRAVVSTDSVNTFAKDSDLDPTTPLF